MSELFIAGVIMLGAFVIVWIPYTELWLLRGDIKQDAEERRSYWIMWLCGIVMFVGGVILC